MPTLDWIGKDKVVNHHLDVPYRVLERVYSYDQAGQHDADNGSENMIIHGDNLEALKALLPQYEGRVKCIYIDPPYNTGNEGWVYNDNLNDPRTYVSKRSPLSTSATWTFSYSTVPEASMSSSSIVMLPT